MNKVYLVMRTYVDKRMDHNPEHEVVEVHASKHSAEVAEINFSITSTDPEHYRYSVVEMDVINDARN